MIWLQMTLCFMYDTDRDVDEWLCHQLYGRFNWVPITSLVQPDSSYLTDGCLHLGVAHELSSCGMQLSFGKLPLTHIASCVVAAQPEDKQTAEGSIHSFSLSLMTPSSVTL